MLNLTSRIHRNINKCVVHFLCSLSDRDSIKEMQNHRRKIQSQMNHFILNRIKTGLSWGCLCSGEVSHSWWKVGAPWDVYL